VHAGVLAYAVVDRTGVHVNARWKNAFFGAAMLAGFAAASAAQADSMSAGLKFGARATDTQRVHFNVFLPLRNTDKLNALLAAQQDSKSPQYHQWLTPAQFGAQFGPSKADLNTAAAYLRGQGFSVQAQVRSLYVTGNASQVTKSFGMQLMGATTHEGRTLLVSTKTANIPNALAAVGATVTGFEPFVHERFSQRVSVPQGAKPASRLGPDGGYFSDDLRQAYSYPANNTIFDGRQFNGAGATVAVLMSSDVFDSDIQNMFDFANWSGITGTPDPKLFGRVYVDGAPVGASLSNPALSEASLDTQSEIGGAPGAHVVLYDIPDLSDASLLDGYLRIVSDDAVDVVGSSFGICELAYFPVYNGGQDFRYILQYYHELFEEGNSEGITFLAATGDFGFSAGQCPTPGYFSGVGGKFIPALSHPSDDPNVTAVGGTNLVTTFSNISNNSAYVRENTYGDPMTSNFDPYGTGGTISGAYWGAGGGVSQYFVKPAYQSLGGVNTTSATWRTNPDIGMQVGGCVVGAVFPCNGGNSPLDGNGNTDRSFFIVWIGNDEGGGLGGLIGTSDSVQEFGSAVADLIQAHGGGGPQPGSGRQGNLNYYIYSNAGTPGFYHKASSIPGFNGLVNSNVSSSYSFSTGVGTPIVTGFIGHPGVSKAGVPGTPSNP
jgi:subtilase family serine protease